MTPLQAERRITELEEECERLQQRIDAYERVLREDKRLLPPVHLSPAHTRIYQVLKRSETASLEALEAALLVNSQRGILASPRRAVYVAVCKMRKKGFEIDNSYNQGFKLVREPERIQNGT